MQSNLLLRFFFLFSFFYIYIILVEATKEQIWRPASEYMAFPPLCVSMCRYSMRAEPHHWAQRGQQEGVMLLKSTTPICLSVRCLAWLSSTQWWCWQNDRRGAHSSECQFGCKAPFPQECWSSHTPKQRKAECCGLYIKNTSPNTLVFT